MRPDLTELEAVQRLQRNFKKMRFFRIIKILKKGIETRRLGVLYRKICGESYNIFPVQIKHKAQLRKTTLPVFSLVFKVINVNTEQHMEPFSTPEINLDLWNVPSLAERIIEKFEVLENSKKLIYEGSISEFLSSLSA